MKQSNLLQEFENETLSNTIRRTKLSAVVSSIAFMLFNILDYFMYPEFYTTLLVIRLAVVVANTGIFLFVETRFGNKHPREIAMLEYMVYGLSIVIMIHRVGGYISPYYAGINIVLFGFIFIWISFNSLRLKKFFVLFQIIPPSITRHKTYIGVG